MSSRERFERDGFVAVESFLSRSEVATCLREVERYVAEVVPGLPAEHVFYENKDDLATLKHIGGGFFGMYLSVYFARKGHEVILSEKENDFMQRASYVNQARVHNGYHYPRSILIHSGTTILR